MLQDARQVLEETAAGIGGENSYSFAAGVIVIPADTEVQWEEGGFLTLRGYTGTLAVGDIFGISVEGYPIAYRAEAVEAQSDGSLRVETSFEGTEDAIASISYTGSLEADLASFEAAGETTYYITDTSEDGQGQVQLLSIEPRDIHYDNKTKTLTASLNLKVDHASAGSISVVLRNCALEHEEDFGFLSVDYCRAVLTADAEVTSAITFDFGDYAGLPSSLAIGREESGLKKVTFEPGTSSVLPNLFRGAAYLSDVTLVDTITSIGASAFEGCSSLEQIHLPDSISYISSYAFISCEKLTSIIIPERVTKIEKGTFSSCVALEEISLPSTLTSIGDDAFSNCTSLKMVHFPNSITNIGNSAFSGSGLTSILLPSQCLSLGKNSFQNCDSLSSVILSNALQQIGDRTFYDCDVLEEIVLPDSVQSIGANCFQHCDLLKTVILGEGILRHHRTIVSAAFAQSFAPSVQL